MSIKAHSTSAIGSQTGNVINMLTGYGDSMARRPIQNDGHGGGDRLDASVLSPHAVGRPSCNPGPFSDTNGQAISHADSGTGSAPSTSRASASQWPWL